MLKLHNTATKETEAFSPISPRKVGLYSCGPTVYGPIHIGNLRAFFLSDITRRTLEYNGFRVKQVMNITDVGHLVSDGDDGEDKMTKGLRREGLEVTIENMLKLADRYANGFKADLAALNIKTPHVMPKASEHIDEDIEILKTLEEKGYTYKTSDGLYFDTSKMPDYGKLGGLVTDGESRIGENSEKKNAADFALWKFDESQGWESPWGRGFPGWHIECSGMSMKYLGDHFDIHTGGQDLSSIHHNNEIAQSESATGHVFVNYWLHNEFLNFCGEKLSKSTGGNITLESVRENGLEPLSYRYLLLQAHYRSKQDFTWDALAAAETALNRLRDAYHAADKQTGFLKKFFAKPDWKYVERFLHAVSNDLDMPAALALTWELAKDPNVAPANKRATLLDFDRVLGLGLKSWKPKPSGKIPAKVQQLLDERKTARANKDWAKSDELRDKIKDLGYEVLDTDQGQQAKKA